MDLFLSDVVYLPHQDRPDPENYLPWDEQRVREFLEVQCALSPEEKIPGRLVVDHDEAFGLWRELIDGGELVAPFEVIHADAHADLGLGDAGYVQLLAGQLHLPVADRANPPRGFSAMNAGNYLAYAIACRWLSSLTYVHHEIGVSDLMAIHFKNSDPDTRVIQLKKCRAGFEKHLQSTARLSEDILELEPEVPFTTCSVNDYVAYEPFHFAVLSRSPKFVPITADPLVAIIMSYFDET